MAEEVNGGQMREKGKVRGVRSMRTQPTRLLTLKMEEGDHESGNIGGLWKLVTFPDRLPTRKQIPQANMQLDLAKS